MPKAYSIDLRSRVYAFVEAGHSCHAAARHFGVSPSFAINLVNNTRARGSLAPKPRGGARHQKLKPYQNFLIARVEEEPDITLYELVDELKEQFDVTVHFASIGRFLQKAGFSYKKNPAGTGIRTR